MHTLGAQHALRCQSQACKLQTSVYTGGSTAQRAACTTARPNSKSATLHLRAYQQAELESAHLHAAPTCLESQ
jgi:hypothetical protein